MFDALLLFQQMFAVPSALFGLLLSAAGIFSAYRAPQHLRPYGPAGVLAYTGLALLLFSVGVPGLLALSAGLVWLMLAALTQTLDAFGHRS